MQGRRTMWLFATLASLAVAAANDNNKGTEVFFRHPGFAMSTLGYVHIHLHFYMLRVVAHMDEAVEMMNLVQLAAGHRPAKAKWLACCPGCYRRRCGKCGTECGTECA